MVFREVEKFYAWVDDMDGILPVKLANTYDPTVWLRNLNNEDPVVFPCWPDKGSGKLAVCMEATTVKTVKISYATSREAMLAYRNPYRLWFCNIPSDEFIPHVLFEEQN